MLTQYLRIEINVRPACFTKPSLISMQISFNNFYPKLKY